MQHIDSIRGPAGLLSVAQTRGAGPALVFVHGNSSNRAIWGPVIARLPGRASLALDLRGHGGSQWARPPAYSTADYAADIAAAVTAAGLDEFVLVGHSNGGLAALWYAAFLAPRPIAVMHLDIEASVPASQVEYFRVRAASVSRPMPTPERLIAGLRQVDPLVPEDAMTRYAQALIREDADGWRLALDPQTYAAWAPADLWTVLPAIACPVTIVRAAESQVMGRAAAEAMRERLPNARLLEIPAAGHLLPIGQPEAVAGAIAALLDAL
jgi:2-(acetamidomethylene)succinate hydrolase